MTHMCDASHFIANHLLIHITSSCRVAPTNARALLLAPPRVPSSTRFFPPSMPEDEADLGDVFARLKAKQDELTRMRQAIEELKSLEVSAATCQGAPFLA